MKIKLAILEQDRSYLTRIVTAFGRKYADKFEIYSFTSPEVALETLNSARIEVLLSSDVFEIDVTRLPNRCAFGYLVESADVELVRNQRAICKFQKADEIYKQILSIYAEKASTITGFKVGGGECSVIAFCSASGGVGSSTMAAACATHFAAQGSKVLYLNLEKFGSADLFFAGQGNFDMSDIIFALKKQNVNLPMKLESCVRQDASGVYFYAGTKLALDMMELNMAEILRLINELKISSGYDYIILDTEFGLDKETLKLYRQAQAVVLIGDGSAESNCKTERAFAALSTMEMNADMPLTSRMSFIYNKVSSKSGQSLNAQGLKILGGAHKYEGATTQQIIGQLSALDLFDTIL